MVAAARAAREAGAEWLGVATLDEALALRGGRRHRPDARAGWRCRARTTPPPSRPGSTSPRTPAPSSTRSPPRPAGRRSPGCSSRSTPGSPAAAPPRGLAGPVRARRATAEEDGCVRVTGIWSHFACSDEPEHPANDAQEAAFREACALAEDAGLDPEVRHLANSAGALLRPGARFDLVRCGIATLRPRPAPGRRHRRRSAWCPAMTVRARLALVKRIAGRRRRLLRPHLDAAERTPRSALVPVGYGEGVPARRRQPRRGLASAGTRRPVRGRVCMDQFVVDLGDDERGGRRRGRAVRRRRPTASRRRTDWAEAVRHDQLRDRHPDRRPLDPPHRRRRGDADVSAAPPRPDVRRRGRRRWPRPAPPPGVAHRRRVDRPPRRSRRRVRLGSLRSDPITWSPRTAYALHVEVDELPRRGRRAPAHHGRREQLTVVFVHGYALNLDCWHFQRAGYRGQVPHGVLRPALARPVGPLRARSTPRSTSSATTCCRSSTQVVPEGRSSSSATRWAGWRSSPSPSSTPSCSATGRRRRADLHHRRRAATPPDPVAAGSPTGFGGDVAPRLMAALAAAPRSSTGLRRRGQDIGDRGHRPVRVRRRRPGRYVEFLDEMLAGDAVRRGRGVLPELRRPRQVRASSTPSSGVPTTIICGTEDKITSIGHSRKMHQHIAGSQLVECEGAGHMVIIERHEQVNAALDQLIASADRAAGAVRGWHAALE